MLHSIGFRRIRGPKQAKAFNTGKRQSRASVHVHRTRSVNHLLGFNGNDVKNLLLIRNKHRFACEWSNECPVEAANNGQS